MSGLSLEINDSGANNDILSRIQTYMKTRTLSVVLLTPCYGGQCYVTYVSCLINTMNLFNKLGLNLRVEFCKNDSLVSRARNNLIAKAMHDKEMTHMIFIDADITWNPVDILKLILADKNIVGGVYPIKNYEWNKLIEPGKDVIQEWVAKKNGSQLSSAVSDQDFVQHRLMRYNLNYISNTLEISNNLTRVRHLATGFMLIRRDTIEKMARAFPSTKYTDDVGFLHGDENEYAYALFDCGVEEGHYCSEDWLFCSRWGKMGGETWVDVTINLNHCGVEDFKGSYLASLI
jgi:DNA-binding protein